MDNLDVELNYQGVSIKAKFNKWNMLSGYSGTGKTFLMQAVELFCKNNSITCLYCDYRFADYTDEQIKELSKNAEVVLLDNADLYLNNNLFSWFKQKLFIVCMKDTTGLDMDGVHKYITNYMDEHITIEEF